MLTHYSRAVVLTVILAFTFWLETGFADTPTSKASTVEIQQGPLIGHAVAGMTMLNAPCVYGDHFHYEIRADGELRVFGPITCSKLKAAGGELVCYLDPQLRCQSRQSFSLGAGTPYQISENGVKAGEEFYPWATPQEAIALMPSIETRAKEKCNEVLFWQALDTKNNRTTPLPERVGEQESCKLTLEQICGAAHGRSALLSNGKDVTVLCQR